MGNKCLKIKEDNIYHPSKFVADEIYNFKKLYCLVISKNEINHGLLKKYLECIGYCVVSRYNFIASLLVVERWDRQTRYTNNNRLLILIDVDSGIKFENKFYVNISNYDNIDVIRLGDDDIKVFSNINSPLLK